MNIKYHVTASECNLWIEDRIFKKYTEDRLLCKVEPTVSINLGVIYLVLVVMDSKVEPTVSISLEVISLVLVVMDSRFDRYTDLKGIHELMYLEDR